MEALAAVGLASNVLQFVEFATKIVKTSNELRQDATLSKNREHAAVATHLRGLSQKMLNESRTANQTAGVLSPEEKVCLTSLAFRFSAVPSNEKSSNRPTRQSWRAARIWQSNF